MQRPFLFHRHRTAAFTLIELLAAVAVVAVLAGLLVPLVGGTRDRALQSKCLGQLRSTYLAAQLYTAENNGQIVPGSIRDESTDADAELWSVRLVPYFNEENNAKSARFACPKWRSDATSKTAYNWGYAMNVTPGFEGAASTSDQKAVSVITHKTNGTATGRTFLFSAITHQSRRLFFCDSHQWHVRGQHIEQNNQLSAYDRHGRNRCNVVFFDGHMETLTPRGVDSAIHDPANFSNTP